MSNKNRARGQRVVAGLRAQQQQQGAVRWTPAPRPITPAVLKSQPAAGNPYRVGDILTRGMVHGRWASAIVIASYGEFVDFGLFADDEMDALETVRHLWVGNVGLKAVRHA